MTNKPLTNKPLTKPQEKFARGVASGLTQAEAYRQAYPLSKKWKPETVHREASAMAHIPKVSTRIAELAKKVEEEFTVKTSDLLREAARVAFSDVRNLTSADGKVNLPNELTEDAARAVASFEIDEYGRIKYKFWDKNAALEKLFKHKGLFKEDNAQKPPVIHTVQLVALEPEPEGD